MKRSLPQSRLKWAPMLAILGALVLAAGLFILIPLTQLLNAIEEPDLSVRETRITLPPQEPPQQPPQNEEPPEEPLPTVPEMPSDPPPVEVPPLDLAFSPGMGEAIAMGVAPTEFRMEGDSIAEVQDFFSFDDLNENPRLLSTPHFRFPQALERRGVREGEVIVEIDILPDGRAELIRIVSSTHAELEPVAVRIIDRARFSPPIVEGQARRVRGHFPLVLQN